MGKNLSTMPETCAISLDSVQIPLRLDDRFIPPDLESALRFYPNYRSQGGRCSFGGYLSWILKQIDRAAPQGYTGQEAFDEFVAWLGGMPEFLVEYHRKYFTDP